MAIGFSDLSTTTVEGGLFRLNTPLIWHYDHNAQIIVPQGFLTDFASIPRGFRWLITGLEETRKPAVVHDYLYRYKIGSRKDADLSFRLGMRHTKTPAWKRELCYWAVRVGGWASWNSDKAFHN